MPAKPACQENRIITSKKVHGKPKKQVKRLEMKKLCRRMR